MSSLPSGAPRRSGSSLVSLLITAGVVAVVLAACQGGASQQEQTPAAAQQAAAMSPVERGKHLVTIMSCNDCHTPLKMGPNGPEADMALLFSGHPQGLVMPPAPALGEGPWLWAGAATMTAFAGPWGVSFSANITPDTTTGIGAWTEDMFIETLRNGKHMGSGRPLLPPMPWMWAGQMTDDELKAVWAYIRTIPPIQNQVPAPIMAAAPPPGMGE